MLGHVCRNGGSSGTMALSHIDINTESTIKFLSMGYLEEKYHRFEENRSSYHLNRIPTLPRTSSLREYIFLNKRLSTAARTPELLSKMSSKIVEDMKTGLKGVRGAGDALRGGLMEATDQAFDNNQNHSQTQASELKNRATTEKGKMDMQAVDDRLAQREREREAERLTQPGKGAGHHPCPLQ
ncbi:hypothetical protein F5Y19DRAFT_424329 [Xylariaceae sp. FL1651]|nr:hypothetical protein F5Y19DRAFT_424329 [Xylariaceae sp. FL1651]